MGSLSNEDALLKLLEIMRERGLSWVAAQVQEQIRAGKPVTKSIETKTVAKTVTQTQLAFPDGSDRKPRKTRSEVAAVEEYTPAERIGIAVSALEHAVLHGVAVRQAVHGFFHEKLRSENPVRFEPEELEEAEPFALQSSEPGYQADLDELRQLLQTLRREL